MFIAPFTNLIGMDALKKLMEETRRKRNALDEKGSKVLLLFDLKINCRVELFCVLYLERRVRNISSALNSRG